MDFAIEGGLRVLLRVGDLRLLLRVGSLAALAATPSAGLAQDAARREWEIAGVPALSFDSDEGMGYGVVAELYNYGGDGATRPYRFTVQPTVALTTEGRRDLTLYLDAPALLPSGWRLTAFLGSEKHVATPWYGVGNATAHDVSLDADDGPDPYYYRFGRTRSRLQIDGQRVIAGPVRALVGVGFNRVRIDPTPQDEGSTLLEGDLGPTPPTAEWVNHARAGLIWDTRDREIGPRRGVWSEVLVQRYSGVLGADASFTRWTVTDRRYYPIGSRLVFANRALLQGTTGDAPFHELQVVQTSAKPQEGLGGAKTLRGLPKNRYAGAGLFLWNAELRWRALEFTALGKPFHLVLSGFADSGRTWAEVVDLETTFTDLHHGYGGGVRVGMGESFVVALDVGHSAEATAPLYIGLGYLY
jgi:hypothetical protein